MYIAMNRFLIKNGKEELFEEIWKSRETHLEETPGFINFNLSSKPSSDVLVKISADSDNQFYINDHRKVETLTFDSSNWDLLQSIQRGL